MFLNFVKEMENASVEEKKGVKDSHKVKGKVDTKRLELFAADEKYR